MTHVGSNLLRAVLIYSLILPLGLHADVPPVITRTNLSEAQSLAVADAAAHARDLEWRVFTAEVNGRPRSVVLLGEHHLAYAEDLASAKNVIDQFEFFATENGMPNDDPAWSYWTINLLAVAFAPIAAAMMLLQGRQPTSPMGLARKGARKKSVRNAEILHEPKASEEIQISVMTLSMIGTTVGAVIAAQTGASFLFGTRTAPKFKRMLSYAAGAFGAAVGPGLIYPKETEWPLVKNRDVSIAKFIDGWIHNSGDDGPMLVILGKLHLHNISNFLTGQYGFTEAPLAALRP